jgi:hypothetical protein
MKYSPPTTPIAQIQNSEISLDDLLSRIDLCNNGYIFAPTGAEMAAAKKHPEVISIRNGRIYRASTPTEFFPMPRPRPVISPPLPDWDIEAAILSQQESRHHYL